MPAICIQVRATNECMKMMDNDNECTPTSTSLEDQSMMTMTMKTVESRIEGGDDNAMDISQSDADAAVMENGASSSTPHQINPSASYDNEIHSPEPQDLTIDEGIGVEGVKDEKSEHNNNNKTSPPPPESPEQEQQLQSPEPDSQIRSPNEPESLQITESSISIPVRRYSSIDVDDHGVQEHNNEDEDEDVDMYEDIDVKQDNVETTTSKAPPASPPVDNQGPSSPPPPASPPIDNQGPCSPSPDADQGPASPVYTGSSPPSSSQPGVDDSNSTGFQKNEESMLSQDGSAASENPPESPEGSAQSSLGDAQMSEGEESQSQPSPPAPKKAKKVREIEEGEDLEEGELEDDEDEEEGTVAPTKSSSKKDKEKSKLDKKKGKEELDPVKRLLAEVREKDTREKEEREKRRKEKKRSHEEKKPKDKESSSSKKKKRRSDDEEGEEFLFVRGASPGAEGIWEEDDRRRKRRESEDDRHRVNASPPRSRPTRNRPEERRPPKSDIICAYFMQGKCQKSADQCNFSHDAIPPRKMELCKFWMMDCCAKKEKCLYLHNDFPCKYFHTGLVCRQGDRCKFSHNALSDEIKQVLLKHIETAPKEILGDFPRLNRTGALNLINKMEAKLKGIPYVEQEDNDNGDLSQSRGHGLDRHGGSDRFQDRQHDRRDNRFGGPPHDTRGRGHDRGMQDHRDKRTSRWEQQQQQPQVQNQPTKTDQERLQELMQEAGMSGFYKDTLVGSDGKGNQNQTQTGGTSSASTNQSAILPTPTLGNLNPSLLPLLPQFLPGMLPQGQNLPPLNNPAALASMLASLNIPPSMIPNLNFPPPSTTAASSATSGSQSDDTKTPKTDSEPGTNIPDSLPKMQRELFERIQQQQKKNQNKVQPQPKDEPEEPPEENWYSDEEEEDVKKKEERKAEISDQISSVLNQIRQQSQQQSKEPEGLKTFFGDTDLRTSAPGSKDVDLRTTAPSIFKKINILPCTEINASINSHPPMEYKVYVVAGLRERPDYSSVRHSLTPQQIVLDPRLGPRKRSNSIPAPESPTAEQPEPLSNPMRIPNSTSVFDPRTKGGNNPGRGLLDTPNPFDTASFPSGMNMNMNDINPFGPHRDPRSQTGNQAPPPNPAALAQNFAAALMQQQYGQAPIDPSLFMLGFPFLPQGAPPPGGPGSGHQHQGPPPMDFNNMMGNRMRPPFIPGPGGNQSSPPQQPPPASSWERFNRGQGMSPPL